MRRTATTIEPTRRAEAPSAPTRGAAAVLPPVGERLLPWFGAAVIVALLVLGVLTLREHETSPIEIATLLAGLCATLAVAGLVAARSARAVEAHEREERARPARDQLPGVPAGRHGEGHGSRSYLAGMERWTVALLELLVRSMELTQDDHVRQELADACEDTDALRVLLEASSQRDLTLSEAATLHSVCTLWETNQARMEAKAAAVDPAWHRRWRARSVDDRLLRHGPPAPAAVELPYRS